LPASPAPTPKHESKIRRLDEALQQAKASGDEEAIKAADAAVWAARKRLHRQGFGKQPADDIQAEIPEEIAQTKK
jgi:hypothetical protein